MNHLDEGTIHAWLDGALEATQSREIEAHVAQCPTCSAVVAEARGLVAASSRILTALDDVQGGVVPKRAAPALKPARRQWRAAPWVSAIAATLIIAVALRVNRLEQLATRPATLADTATVSTAQPQERVATTPATPEPAAGFALRDSAAPTRVRAVAASVRNGRVDSSRSRDLSASDAVASAPSGAGAGAEGLRKSVAAAPAAPTPAPVAAEPRLKLPVDQIVVTAAADAREKRSEDELETDRFAGCYRIEPMPRQALASAAQKAASAVGRVAAETRAASRPMAADYVAPSPPAFIRLDSLKNPRGYVARDARSDSAVGVWRGVGQDSARVDMLAAGLFTVALKNRTVCPER